MTSVSHDARHKNTNSALDGHQVLTERSPRQTILQPGTAYQIAESLEVKHLLGLDEANLQLEEASSVGVQRDETC
jgi:hypothetical protein